MNFVLIFSNLKKYLRKKGGNVAFLSEDDFSSLQETIYLCQSPKNLSTLLEALNRKEGHSLEIIKNALGL